MDRQILREDEQQLRGAGLEHRTEIGKAGQSIEQDPDIEVRRDDQVDPSWIRIDLGCGPSTLKRQGFLGMDRVRGAGVDILHDFTVVPWVGVDGLPLADSSVYELAASHVLEHVRDLNALMEEAWRVLMPGSLFHIRCPYWASSRAWQDPDHCRAMTEDSFRYYDRVWATRLQVDGYASLCDFEQVGLRQELAPGEDQYAEETKKYRVKHFNNVVYNIEYVLRCVKPMREVVAFHADGRPVIR